MGQLPGAPHFFTVAPAVLSQENPLAAVSHRALGSLDDLDNTQAIVTVGLGRFAFADAIEEMLALNA
jgi:hypothetical protein